MLWSIAERWRLRRPVKQALSCTGLFYVFAKGIGWKFQAFAEWIFALRPAMDRYVACRASNTILMPHASGQGLVEQCPGPKSSDDKKEASASK